MKCVNVGRNYKCLCVDGFFTVDEDDCEGECICTYSTSARLGLHSLLIGAVVVVVVFVDVVVIIVVVIVVIIIIIIVIIN